MTMQTEASMARKGEDWQAATASEVSVGQMQGRPTIFLGSWASKTVRAQQSNILI
jgi:hypothetical protein